MANWKLTVRLADLVKGYHDGEYGINELAKKVAAHIRATKWKNFTSEAVALEEALVELETATGESEYREKFDTIYDIADEDRVWIEIS